MKTKIIPIFAFILCTFLFNQVKAQSDVIIYTDNFGPGISNSFFPNTGGTMSEVTTEFYSGTKSIEWFVGTKPYANLNFTVWPYKNYTDYVADGFNFEFYFKSPSTSLASNMYLKAKFWSKLDPDPKIQTVYNLTPVKLIADGEWHKVSIPLSSFTASAGFTWASINYIEIITDHTNLNGATLYFDELKIASRLTSVTNQIKSDINNFIKIYPNVVKHEAKIAIGEVEGEMKLYDITGRMVHNFGIVKSNSEIIWKEANQLPNGMYYCKLDNFNGEAVKILIQH